MNKAERRHSKSVQAERRENGNDDVNEAPPGFCIDKRGPATCDMLTV